MTTPSADRMIDGSSSMYVRSTPVTWSMVCCLSRGILKKQARRGRVSSDRISHMT